MVSFDSGVRYRWKKADMWSGKWCFRHAERESCVCLSQDAGPLVQGGRVSVCCGAADLPETPVLLLLGLRPPEKVL
jgi:hypothetical protein